MADVSIDLATVSAATFAAEVGSVFRVVSPGAPDVPLRLVEVEARGRQPHAPRVEPFSLVFAGPPEPRLVQRTHRLEHQVLGALEIFLVPIGQDASGGILYEATFN